MTLKKYNSKRDFSKTPEPKGTIAKAVKQPKQLYIIQKHAASHLHYDFRLEMDGVLKSWAVPKGPSLDPKVKRLAVHVEDHPLDYGSFEGIIPADEYGGGTVMLWDQGSWEMVPDKKKSYKLGNFTFKLHGKKLKGIWKLIRLKNDAKNWLLVKGNDEFARSEVDYDITDAKPNSVVSKKTMLQLAKGANKIWTSNKTKKAKKQNIILGLETGNKSDLPKLIHPELATLVTAAPKPEKDWLYEIKFDGYRILSFIKKNTISLITRKQQNWTNKFPKVVQAIKRLKLSNAILDGELVALNDENAMDFQALQNSIHHNTAVTLIYNIFDIIYYDTQDLTQLPLLERKKILQQVLANNNSPLILYSDSISGNGKHILQHACKLGLEGIIAKNIHSTYQQKRTKDWLKLKCHQRQEFVVGGFTKPQGKRDFFGSLLLGYYNSNQELCYCGHVGTGFTQQSLKEVYTLLQKLISAKNPFKAKKIAGSLKNITWVKPTIIVEVEFFAWTSDKILRHPSYKGLRLDKKPQTVRIEKAVTTPSKTKSIINKKSNAMKPIINTDQLEYSFSHPDKIYYKEDKISKLDIAKFYYAIQDWILPYLINRPLSLVRCPQGYDHECFFQKHLEESLSEGIHTIAIEEKETKANYAYITDIHGLISLVQIGVLELHIWGSKIKNVAKPDLIVFDLDPAPDVPWKNVIKSAHLIREELALLNLESFVKTTGGKGLHILIPIKPDHSWDTIKEFSKQFAETVEQKQPKQFVSNMAKAKRAGKIFIDYLRNSRGATSVAAYSTRAKITVPVSTPLRWDELTTRTKSQHYTIHNLIKRLKKLEADPWEGFLNLKQVLQL